MKDGDTSARVLSDWQRRQLRQMLESWRASNFNPYVVLGLETDASPEQVRQAHRRLAKFFHPDLHFNDPIAVELLKEINVARDRLGASARRNRGPDFSGNSTYETDTTRHQHEPRNQDREDWQDYRFRQRDHQGQQSHQHAGGFSHTSNSKKTGTRNETRNFDKTAFQIALGAAFLVALFLLVAIVFDSIENPSSDTVDLSQSNTPNAGDNLTASAVIRTAETSETRDQATFETTPVTEPIQDSSVSELDEWRQYALRVINEERQKAGLSSVALVDIPATQRHAEDTKENCFVSPWGTDGMKPYMRYSKSGGYQHTSEVVHGSNYCPTFGFLYERESIQEQIDQAISATVDLEDPETLDILDPHVRNVAIGMAYREPSLWTVLTFISDYVEYQLTPFIHNQTLQFTATAKHGVDFTDEDLSVAIFYDEPVKPLNRGQLHQTYCYWHGEFLAFVREPLEEGWVYEDDTIAFPSERCVDPYGIPADTPPIDSPDSWTMPTAVPIVEEGIALVADTWETDSGKFRFEADLSILLSLFGEGVYTMVLYTTLDGEPTSISEYSIFVPGRTN